MSGLTPLYPRKQTFVSAIAMSALGHKRTHAVQQKARSLFDHLVGAGDEDRRHHETHCSCGF
jgi:hypothetical protein